MNVYRREVKGKELPKVVADRIASASNRNLRKALLMLESCYVRQGPLTDSCEPVMAGAACLRCLPKVSPDTILPHAPPGGCLTLAGHHSRCEDLPGGGRRGSGCPCRCTCACACTGSSGFHLARSGLTRPSPCADWEQFVAVIATNITEEQTPKRLLDVRAQFYDLLGRAAGCEGDEPDRFGGARLIIG